MADHKVYRDAGSGEYVTAEFAAANPSTTVSETISVTAHHTDGTSTETPATTGNPTEEQP